jgi:hypothetical protein
LLKKNRKPANLQVQPESHQFQPGFNGQNCVKPFLILGFEGWMFDWSPDFVADFAA